MPRYFQVGPTTIYERICPEDIEPGMVILYLRDGYEVRYGKVTTLETGKVWATWAVTPEEAKYRNPHDALYITLDDKHIYLVEGLDKPKAGLTQFLEKNIDITRAVS